MTISTQIPIALTIAGSDSGGGAGIQADLKTFHQFGVFGTSVVTAVTAQNTVGVHAIHPVPPPEVRAQIEAVVDDLRPRAFKTGMLATAALVDEVAAAVTRHRLTSFVMDPVMVSTSGHRLLESDAETALRDRLLPTCSVITPNLAEASILLGRPVRTVDDMRDAARRLVDLGAGAALIKGGHLTEEHSSEEASEVVVDLLWEGANEHRWTRPRVDTVHTHGTGCTLSAAIVACLARGMRLVNAVDTATSYVGRAIATAPALGRGRGPVNHFASTEPPVSSD